MQSESGSKTEDQRIDLSYDELTRLWDQWINDSSLRQDLRFGQYVLNRFDVVWPTCYYANTATAYNLLYGQTDGIPTTEQV